jgi:hypothetical protein
MKTKVQAMFGEMRNTKRLQTEFLFALAGLAKLRKNKIYYRK